MSKRINVNPDHYKTGGSLRQGDEVVQQAYKRQLTEERARLERWQARQQRAQHEIETRKQAEEKRAQEETASPDESDEGEQEAFLGQSYQKAGKRGKESAAIEEASSRYPADAAPIPSTAPVEGAHGKAEGRPRSSQPRRLAATDKANVGRKKIARTRGESVKKPRKKAARSQRTSAGGNTSKETTGRTSRKKSPGKKAATKKPTRKKTARKKK